MDLMLATEDAFWSGKPSFIDYSDESLRMLTADNIELRGVAYELSKAENVKPLNFEYAQLRGPPRSPAFINPSNKNENRSRKFMGAIDHLRDPVNKGRKFPEMDDFNAKENKLIRKYQLSEHWPVKKNTLLPLCLEDELRDPNAKIIDTVPAKAGTTPVEEQWNTKPIIFHDARNILMWLLRKCRFTPHVFTYKRKNFVLERNCAIFKSLISDQSRTLSKHKRTPMSAAWKKDIQGILCERIHRTVKEKVKKGTEKRPWGRPYTLSHSLSSLPKNFEGYFDKTSIQEKRTNKSESRRMYLMSKPRSVPKFHVLPVKCCPKPSKNSLEVCKLNNVTPLDNLLNLPSEMK